MLYAALYVKNLAGSLITRAREEAGQNMVETALIIGLVSLVLVGAFMASNLAEAVENLAEEVECAMQNKDYDGTGACI